LAGRGHDLFETRVDDINFVGTLELTDLVREAHKLKQTSLRLDLVLLGKTAGSDVIEVLQPLEVGAGDTTTVDKHVWGTDNTATLEDNLGGVSGRAVGTLEDSLNLDLLSVTLVEGLLDGGRDHAISLLNQVLLRVLTDALGGSGERSEGTMLDHVCFDLLNIETIRVVASGVVLNDSGDNATILLDELGGPVADSAEALDDEGLASNTLGKAATIDEGLGAEHLTDGVVDTEAGGLGAASNTALGDELSSAAALSVDVLLTLHVNVGILDPGHNLLVGAHIGSEAIDLSTDKALLDELHSVLAGHSLDLVLGVLARVNLDTTLGTTERNISDGKLEGHEGSESFDLLKINISRVASATLDGKLVGRVLGSVASDGLKVSVVSTEGDVEPDDSLASLDHVEVLLLKASHLGGLVVEKLDLLEETGLLVGVDLRSELLCGAERAAHGGSEAGPGDDL